MTDTGKPAHNPITAANDAEQAFAPFLKAADKAEGAAPNWPTYEALYLSAGTVLHEDGSKGVVLKLNGRACNLAYEIESAEQLDRMMARLKELYQAARQGPFGV